MIHQPTLDFDPASDTSRDSNVYALPNRERDKSRVLHALVDAGERGLTDFELAEILSARGPRIGQTSAGKRRLDLERGKRRLDLERDGLVARRLVIGADDVLVPDRRPSPTGAPAGVYCLASYSKPS